MAIYAKNDQYLTFCINYPQMCACVRVCVRVTDIRTLQFVHILVVFSNSKPSLCVYLWRGKGRARVCSKVLLSVVFDSHKPLSCMNCLLIIFIFSYIFFMIYNSS